MPRAAKFTDDEILDAVLEGVAQRGHGVSVADIARNLGGPVGSIYYRFPSRDALLIRLWLRSVARFQAGLFVIERDGEREGLPTLEVLVRLAAYIPQYCRQHREEGIALTLYRQERLVQECPEELREAVTHVNDDLNALLTRLTLRHFGRATKRERTLMLLALRFGPYGMVRPYLGRDLPPLLDEVVAATARAVLTLDERPPSRRPGADEEGGGHLREGPGQVEETEG